MLLVTIVGAAVAYCLYWVLRIALRHHKYSHIPGPKRASFLLGNAALLRKGTEENGNLGSVFLKLMLEHGNVYVIWRVTTPTIVTGDLTAVKEYYTNLKLFKKPTVGLLKLNRIGQTNFIGNHSILSDVGGPNWERKKRIMDPGFKISRLQAHISKFYAIGEQVAEDLEKEQARDGLVDFRKIIAPYTIHAISSAGFSVLDDTTLQELSEGATVIADYWVNSITEMNPFKRSALAAILGMDSPGRPAAETQLKHVRKLGKRLIMSRIDSGEFGKANDALDFIILANEDNGNLQMERCLDDFMTMYEAGNVTTATTLSFLIAELVRNTGCLTRLIKEVEDVWVTRRISRDSANEEIVGALKDMVYLDAVLNETLRLHPPVTVGNRVLQQSLDVMGYKIPAGTSFVVSQQVLHLHPQYWDNPHLFDPERFLGNKEIVPFTFVPFIVGRRRCLGKNFAVLEMKVFVSIWLSRMTFEKLPGTKEEILTEQGLLVRMLDNRVLVKMR